MTPEQLAELEIVRTVINHIAAARGLELPWPDADAGLPGWLAFVAFLAACARGICRGETRPDPTPNQHCDNVARVTTWRPM